ncbi:MAG: hypothetical protein CM1200mP30_09100 [Pseudomonadota bacterium]|nr:MAG: hypothetical protein CM1200mP30_09100 [Pseudomonadota bacterium]
MVKLLIHKKWKKESREFRKGKPWNVKGYDKNGNIENEWEMVKN